MTGEENLSLRTVYRVTTADTYMYSRLRPSALPGFFKSIVCRGFSVNYIKETLFSMWLRMENWKTCSGFVKFFLKMLF
jgi:hypothetical protein